MNTQNTPSPFLLSYEELLNRLEDIDPLAYARSRNYLTGAVTRLSPFITHGVLQLPDAVAMVLSRFAQNDCDKLLAEFAWREYFQYLWLDAGESIFTDLIRPQPGVEYRHPASKLIAANSGIQVIDTSCEQLMHTGYMHNHARLWTAFLHCHVAKTHWYEPARWLYYHLLDGDLASNFLSWQWVAGTSRNRIYVANQENLNKYSQTLQKNTCIDIPYDELEEIRPPEAFDQHVEVSLPCRLPASDCNVAQLTEPNLLGYSIWNLDPGWHADIRADRVLLLEPSLFRRFPVSDLRWQFILHWAGQIPGLRLFVGEFSEFDAALRANRLRPPPRLQFRDHPTTAHWLGEREPRRFVWPRPDGPMKGFFNFWAQVKGQHQC